MEPCLTFEKKEYIFDERYPILNTKLSSGLRSVAALRCYWLLAGRRFCAVVYS